MSSSLRLGTCLRRKYVRSNVSIENISLPYSILQSNASIIAREKAIAGRYVSGRAITSGYVTNGPFYNNNIHMHQRRNYIAITDVEYDGGNINESNNYTMDVENHRKCNVLVVGNQPESIISALSLKFFGIPTTIVSNSQQKLKSTSGLIIPIESLRALKVVELDTLVEDLGVPIRSYTRYGPDNKLLGSVDLTELERIHGFLPIGVDKQKLMKGLLSQLNVPLHDITVERFEGLSLKNLDEVTIDNNTLYVVLGEYDVVTASFTSDKKRVKNIPWIKEAPTKVRSFKKKFDFALGTEGPISQVASCILDKKSMKARVSMERYNCIIDRPLSYPFDEMREIWSPGHLVGVVPVSHDKLWVWGTHVPLRIQQNAPPVLHALAPTSAFLNDFKVFEKHEYWEDIACNINETSEASVDYILENEISGNCYSKRASLLGSSAHSIAPIIQGHDLGVYTEEAVTMASFIANSAIPSNKVFSYYTRFRQKRGKSIQKSARVLMSGALSDRVPGWRGKLADFIYKWDNRSKRLMAREAGFIRIPKAKIIPKV